MKKWVFLSLFSLCCIAWSGCESLRDKARVDPQPISPFLKHQELLVRQQPSFPFHYFYLKADAGTYENVYIAPTDLSHLRKNKNWAELDQSVAAELQHDIKFLGEYTRKSFSSAFATADGDKLNVVDSPKYPKTLVVSTAIVQIIPSKAELTILGTAGNIFLPGIGIVANYLAAGAVTIECVVSDAQTGEIIAMYANTESDQKAVLNISGMTWYNSSKNNIDRMAASTAQVFSGKDYSYTKRRLIKIVAI